MNCKKCKADMEMIVEDTKIEIKCTKCDEQVGCSIDKEIVEFLKNAHGMDAVAEMKQLLEYEYSRESK